MPFLHSRSIDWSALTAVYAMWTMRKGTAALAEGVGMPFPESSLHSICLFLTRMDVFVSGVPLFSEDIRSGRIIRSINERIDLIEKEIKKIELPFRVHYEDTIAFTLIDGLSNSESFFMEAV